MKTLRLVIACLTIATSVPSVLRAQNAGAESLERTLMGNQWDVETERGQRAWGDIRFRAGHEFSTMNGPQGNWKVTGARTVELGKYVVEFAPGLESFVVTEKGAGKVATGKRKGATLVPDSSALKTAPPVPASVTPIPVPSLSSPAQLTAKRHAQEVATQIAKLQEPFATITAEAEKATKDVAANYLSALDQLQGQKAAAGDIDGVVALKQERDRVTNNAQPTAADLQAMSAPVRKLRATYEADIKKVADEAVRRDKLACSSYLANLEALQKRMNAVGEIEQGLLVKAEKDRFIAALVAPRSPVTVATPVRNNPPVTVNSPVEQAGSSKHINKDVMLRWGQAFDNFIRECRAVPKGNLAAGKRTFLDEKSKMSNAVFSVQTLLAPYVSKVQKIDLKGEIAVSDTDFKAIASKLGEARGTVEYNKGQGATAMRYTGGKNLFHEAHIPAKAVDDMIGALKEMEEKFGK